MNFEERIKEVFKDEAFVKQLLEQEEAEQVQELLRDKEIDLSIEDIAQIFDIHGIDTEIIAASIRSPQDVVDAALAGAHISTIPYNVICQMMKHPLTDAGIEKFLQDWESVPNK